MNSVRHSWEYGAPWDARDTTHTWEVSPDEEVDPGDLTPIEKGEELADYLLQLKYEHPPLTAKDFCIISFWAHGAGAVRPMENCDTGRKHGQRDITNGTWAMFLVWAHRRTCSIQSQSHNTTNTTATALYNLYRLCVFSKTLRAKTSPHQTCRNVWR